MLRCGKGRARQMNAAAKEAAGDILWFSHCDSLLPKDGAKEIIAAVNAGARFGCFHIGFDYDGPFFGTTNEEEFLRDHTGNRRFWPVECGVQQPAKSVFTELAANLPQIWAEALTLWHNGEKLYLLPGRIITSGRRYNRCNPIITMWQMFNLRCLYRRGVDIEEIARRYRDIR